MSVRFAPDTFTDFTATPRDTSPAIDEQGDVRLYKISLIVREEINNTLRMIDILEQASILAGRF